jgi:hypothetical protein
MATFQDRVIGAIKLQPATFEEVEHDATALSQAAIVVVAAAVAGSLRTLRYGFIGATGATAMVIFAVIGWAIGAALVWLVGTRMMPGKNTEADFQQVLRTVGFAQAPGIFNVLGIIPILGWLVQVVVSIWTLVALVIAVRQVLDYDDTLKAVLVCVVAWVIMFIATMMVGFLGFGAAMAGSMMR